MYSRFKLTAGILVLLSSLLACSFSNVVTATPTSVPIATTVQTQAPSTSAGPTIVTGKVTYTNSFFTAGVAEPEIILEDEGGFVTRNRKFVIPVESQVIGEI